MANSGKDDTNKQPKKSKPQTKPGRKMTTERKVKNLDESVIKKIVENKKEEMSVAALDIAREMAARMDLEIQKPLTDIQEEAAYLYAQGMSISNVAEKIGQTNTQIMKWMKLPAFMKQINEFIFSEDLINKSERIRLEKRRYKELNDVFFDKIEGEDNELKNLPITTIHKMIVDSGKDLSALVDTKDEKTDNNNIQIMIVNHFKSQGHNYNDLDDFLEDPGFDFRNKFIDVDSEDV